MVLEIRTYNCATNKSAALTHDGNAGESMITLITDDSEVLLFTGSKFDVAKWKDKMDIQGRNILDALPPINLDNIVRP